MTRIFFFPEMQGQNTQMGETSEAELDRLATRGLVSSMSREARQALEDVLSGKKRQAERDADIVVDIAGAPAPVAVRPPRRRAERRRAPTVKREEAPPPALHVTSAVLELSLIHI